MTRGKRFVERGFGSKGRTGFPLLSNNSPSASVFPPQQSQCISDDDDVREAHGGGAKDRADETEGGEGDAEGVVKKSPEQVLFDGAQRCAREAERFGHGFD